MGNDDILTDDYVASLLAKDAKESSIKYSAMGFAQSKPPANKPKPNTRFLRNIIKDTDSHNAALLAREAAEARIRLEDLSRSEKEKNIGALKSVRRRQLGDIAAILGGRPNKRRKVEECKPASSEGEDELEEISKEKRARKRQALAEEDQQESKDDRRRKRDGKELKSKGQDDKPRKDRSRDDKDSKSRDRKKESRQTIDEDNREAESAKSRDRKHRKREKQRDSDSDEEEPQEKNRKRERRREREARRERHRDMSKERSRKHSDSVSTSKDHKSHKRKRSRSPSHHRRQRSPMPEAKPKKKLEKDVDYDSDPLDDIIGPPPPPAQEVRSRGRGTISQASGIDRRFSASYDPATDVELNPAEGADWDQALETFRDRQKWKQQGADRLRAAGFTEDEVAKWSKGKKEASEEDVKWSKKGESREWDRGKVVGEDGDVQVDLEWGRLK